MSAGRARIQKYDFFLNKGMFVVVFCFNLRQSFEKKRRKKKLCTTTSENLCTRIMWCIERFQIPVFFLGFVSKSRKQQGNQWYIVIGGKTARESARTDQSFACRDPKEYAN